MVKSRQVWKYMVRHGETSVSMPKGSEVVRFADQYGSLMIWAVGDPDAPQVSRYFSVVGTGHPIGFEYNKHVGSCEQGPYIWHLFENTCGEQR